MARREGGVIVPATLQSGVLPCGDAMFTWARPKNAQRKKEKKEKRSTTEKSSAKKRVNPRPRKSNKKKERRRVSRLGGEADKSEQTDRGAVR